MAQNLDRLDALAKEIQQIRDATISSEDSQYGIKSNVVRDIQKIVDEVSRYNNVSDFVDESIANTIKFWRQPERMLQMAGRIVAIFYK